MKESFRCGMGNIQKNYFQLFLVEHIFRRYLQYLWNGEYHLWLDYSREYKSYKVKFRTGFSMLIFVGNASPSLFSLQYLLHLRWKTVEYKSFLSLFWFFERKKWSIEKWLVLEFCCLVWISWRNGSFMICNFGRNCLFSIRR